MAFDSQIHHYRQVKAKYLNGFERISNGQRSHELQKNSNKRDHI